MMSVSGGNVSSYCGSCGHPVQGDGRFCGNCGKAVSGGSASAAVATRSPMLFVGIAMILVAVFAVAGIVLFGDRLGLASNSNAPEPAPMLEPTTPEEPNEVSEPEEAPEQTEEQEPQPTATEAPAYTVPDPAFDALIPTLQEMTDAPILLPGSLPDEFGGVAIDETTTAEAYDILFFADPPSGGVVQPFVNAYVGATIRAQPGEGTTTDYGSGVTTTPLGDVSLPDGTTASVAYHEAPQAANTNIFATGTFARDAENGEPYSYTVTVEGDSPDAEWTKQLLTSMVFVEDSVQSQAPQEETSEQEFVTRYYDAVAAEDWYTTYSLLDSSSRAEFTEEEWVVAQEARVAATDPPPLQSATVQNVSGEAAGFTADVLLTYTDGTSETIPINAVLESDGLKRYLTPEDASYLRGLVGETSSEEPYSGVAEAVEEFVYGYYDAVAAEDWSATYSMLDYGGQAAFTEPEWTERQEARQAASGAPSPVVDVSVSVPEDYAVDPTTTATVTFADGSSVDITVVNPHDRDADFDRVLTAEEISFLESL